MVWHPPNMARRSSSRNSEPPYISNSTVAGRPTMTMRSLSLRMAPHEREWPLPPTPITAQNRRRSSTVISLERPVQCNV